PIRPPPMSAMVSRRTGKGIWVASCRPTVMVISSTTGPCRGHGYPPDGVLLARRRRPTPEATGAGQSRAFAVIIIGGWGTFASGGVLCCQGRSEEGRGRMVRSFALLRMTTIVMLYGVRLSF